MMTTNEQLKELVKEKYGQIALQDKLENEVFGAVGKAIDRQISMK